MRVAAQGGLVEPEGIDTSALVGEGPLPVTNRGNLLGSFDISPDGTRVIFGARTVPLRELWTLDNVWALVRGR